MTRNRFRLFRDGERWAAVPPGFRDLEQDPIGFGATKEEAMIDLILLRSYKRRAAEMRWPDVTVVDFQVDE
jgi:cellobiose phosphorylase